jgi:hypothetical protein
MIIFAALITIVGAKVSSAADNARDNVEAAEELLSEVSEVLSDGLPWDPCARAAPLTRASCELAAKNHVTEPCVVDDAKVQQHITQCSGAACPRFSSSQRERMLRSTVPLAFTILAHKDALSVMRLIDSIWEPHHLICLSIDSKAPPAFHDALHAIAASAKPTGSIFVASKLQDVQYAKWSRVAADHDCFADLLQMRRKQHPASSRWQYVINLTGQMMPMQSRIELEQRVAALNGVANVEIIKSSFKTLPPFETIEKSDARATAHFLVKGSGFVVLPFKFVEALMGNRGRRVREWIQEAHWKDDDPFERIYPTFALIPGWPGGLISETGERAAELSHFRAGWKAVFVQWSSTPCFGHPPWGSHPCVFGAGDLPHLLYERTGKNCGSEDANCPVCESDALFVNKFDSAVDAVVRDCFALEFS